jgi:hypothetical protein
LGAGGVIWPRCIQGMCAKIDITDPSNLSPSVAAAGAAGGQLWLRGLGRVTPALYNESAPTSVDNNPGEEVHLAFLRWYTDRRRPQGEHSMRVILEAANQLQVLQHWLPRSLQLWNKLATAAPDCWLAHQALLTLFVENV